MAKLLFIIYYIISRVETYSNNKKNHTISLINKTQIINYIVDLIEF